MTNIATHKHKKMLDDVEYEFDGNQSLFDMVAKQVQHVEFNNVGWC